MEAVLIFDSSQYEHDVNIETKEFKSKAKLLDYVNENVGQIRILKAYEVYKKIEFTPVQTITKYAIL